MAQNKSKQRLFEVMGRLDKTFKPKLNENFEEVEDDIPAEIGGEAGGAEMAAGMEAGGEAEMDEPKELSPEEKLAELTAKVDEMHALLHGEADADLGGEPEEIEVTTGEVDVDVNDAENLQEWNFDKKKGNDKEEKGDDDDKEEKEEVDETEEKKPKIPVAAVAKVGK